MAANIKTNVYQMVTDRIMAELEKGVIPWKKPWAGVRSGAFNRVSRKPYSLLNQMLLKHTGEYYSTAFHELTPNQKATPRRIFKNDLETFLKMRLGVAFKSRRTLENHIAHVVGMCYSIGMGNHRAKRRLPSGIYRRG